MSNVALKGDVWSSKLQSFVVIEDKKEDLEIITEDNVISVVRSDGKSQTFTYDCVVDEGLREQILLKLKKSVHLVRLGFNSSIYINGSSKNQQDSVESMIVLKQIQELYSGFESDERNNENGIQSSGETLLFRNVKFSSYELFDGHIVDLSPQKGDESSKGKPGVNKRSVQELKLSHGAVTNLTKEVCPTADSAIAFVTHALRTRQFLVAGIAVGQYDSKISDIAKLPTFPPRLIGAISSVFILANIEQLVYVIASGESKTIESTLEFVVFPSSDVLSTKPDIHEGIQSIRLSDFTPHHLISGAPDEIKIRNNKLLVSLQTGLQALSALTRIVKGLSGGNGSSDKDTTALSLTVNTVGGIQTQKHHNHNHIPFRDSIFTRLLQKSINGNCSVFMISTINGSSEGLIKNLRFATEIRNLSNKMWSYHTPGPSATCPHTLIKISEMAEDFIAKNKSYAEQDALDQKNKPKRSSMAAFNDVLKGFHDSLIELAEFSAAFYQKEAQVEREIRLLSGLGITPSHTPPIASQDYGDDELIEVIDIIKNTARLPTLASLNQDNVPVEMSLHDTSTKESVWGDSITGKKELPGSRSLPRLSRVAATNSNNSFKTVDDRNSCRTDARCTSAEANEDTMLRVPSPVSYFQASERGNKKPLGVIDLPEGTCIRELPLLNTVKDSVSPSSVSLLAPVRKSQNKYPGSSRSSTGVDCSPSPDPSCSGSRYGNMRSADELHALSNPRTYSVGSQNIGMTGSCKSVLSVDENYRFGSSSSIDTPAHTAEECVSPSTVVSALNNDDINEDISHSSSSGGPPDVFNKSLGAILFRKLSEHHHIQSLNGYVSNEVEGWVADINTNKSATGSPVTPAPYSIDKVQSFLNDGRKCARGDEKDSETLPSLSSKIAKNRHSKDRIQVSPSNITNVTRPDSPVLTRGRNTSAEGSARVRNRSAGGNSPVPGSDLRSSSNPRSQVGRNRSAEGNQTSSSKGGIQSRSPSRLNSIGDPTGKNRSATPTNQILHRPLNDDFHGLDRGNENHSDISAIDQLNLDISEAQDDDTRNVIPDDATGVSLPSLFRNKIPSHNIIDHEDDGLNLSERKYLKAISQNNHILVEEFLRGKGNCNVVNGFGR